MYEISMNIGGIVGGNCDSKQKLIEKLMLFKEAGITCLDGMCVCNDLVSTDKWIDDFKAAIDEVGLRVAQTHLPIFGQINTETGSPVWKLNEEEKKLIETGFRSNAVWGCKNVVVHPHTGYPKSANKDIIIYRQMNIDYFKLLLEYAHKYGWISL